MNLDTLNPLGWAFLGAIAIALLALGAWYFWPGGRRRLLPPQRCRAVPWSSAEVFAAIFLEYFFWVGLVYEALKELGLFTWLYGPDFLRALENTAPEAKAAHMLAVERVSIWVAVLTCPPVVASIVLFFRAVSGTRPYQLGLTWHRAGKNVLAGLLAAVAFIPFVYLVFGVASWVWAGAFHAEPEEHPLARLAHQPLRPVEWVVLVLSAVVASPVLEELLFRGVFQRWLARRTWGGMAAVTAAAVLALSYKMAGFRHAREAGDWPGALQALAPVLFVLAVAPGVLLLQKRSDVAAAIYGTALLFGAAHSFAWPTPVPLFLLGLVLGLLAYRTQSLVGPITLHALFNGVACVLLLWPYLTAHPEPGKGNGATSAPRRAAPASTSTAVPGSWCPRRT